MSNGTSAKKESPAPGCFDIMPFGIALIFFGVACFLMFQALSSLQRGDTFSLSCFSFLAVVLAGVSSVAFYNFGKRVLVKYTLETDFATGGPIITASLLGITLSTKKGAAPRKVDLNPDGLMTRYPPSIVTLHDAVTTGLNRRGGMKWYRYPASLIEGPVAVLGAIQALDFYRIDFKEESITGASKRSVEFFVRPGPRHNAKIMMLQERRIIKIVGDWDAQELSYGMPLFTLAREMFGRYYFKDAQIMLRMIMKDAKNQGLGHSKWLGMDWQTSPEHAAIIRQIERLAKSVTWQVAGPTTQVSVKCPCGTDLLRAK